MQVSSGARPPAQITMITKGDRIRLDVPSANGPAAHSILDVARKQVLVVLDGPKIAITRPLPAPPPAAAASAPAQVTKTGKHETIAGHDCEDWNVVESSGKHSQLCMASGIPFFDFTQIAPPGSGQVFGAWMRDVKDASAFPLKAVTTDASGKEESTMQVTKIDPHPVDDSLFVAPPGYRSVGPPAGPPR